MQFLCGLDNYRSIDLHHNTVEAAQHGPSWRVVKDHDFPTPPLLFSILTLHHGLGCAVGTDLILEDPVYSGNHGLPHPNHQQAVIKARLSTFSSCAASP